MADVVTHLVEHHQWAGRVGVAFPAVIRRGVAHSAANVDPSWIGTDADALFTKASGHDVHVVNDADAAGLAEMRYGAGRDRDGVVIVFTFGTGIGSGFFLDGRLVPNTELGHLEIDGHDAERRAAASARDRDGLSWPQWAERVETYLRHVVFLFSPELVIVGGGASRKADKWLPHDRRRRRGGPRRAHQRGRHRRRGAGRHRRQAPGVARIARTLRGRPACAWARRAEPSDATEATPAAGARRNQRANTRSRSASSVR